MRLVTFASRTEFGTLRRLGALEADRVIDLPIAYRSLLRAQGMDEREAQRVGAGSLPESMEDFIRAGRAALVAAQQAMEFARSKPESVSGPGARPGILSLGDVKLTTPLSTPNSIRDFVAFEDHAKAGAARRGEDLDPIWYQRPIYYKGNHRALIGPGDEISRPPFTKSLDFELEVACIIGVQDQDLLDQEAGEAIFGFTILNDWSARDVQADEMAVRLGPAKSKDFATSIGPCILTADETGPHPSLAMTARLNGEVVCEANLGDAHWRFPTIISFVSQGETIWPTDIYGSGTPFGGCLLDRGGPFLKPGDVVELEVGGIGVLSNRVATE